MGTWGVGISANDDFQDVKDIFFYFFYHEKISITDIENKITAIYRNNLQDEKSGDWHNIYFAIAYCEWKCGCLSDKIFQTVKRIIESGKDLKYWKELNADESTLQKRASELRKFLEKINVTNTKPIRRKYKIPFVFPLKTGDVFACFSKTNGCFGCGVALEVRDSQLKPWEEEFHFSTLIAISDYTPKELPTIEQIINSKARDVFWNGGCSYNLPKKGFIILGNVADKIDRDYSEYFGNFKIDGKIYGVQHLRPSFDELISADKSKRIIDKFSVPNRPISFFFDKGNLSKTIDIQEKYK